MTPGGKTGGVGFGSPGYVYNDLGAIPQAGRSVLSHPDKAAPHRFSCRLKGGKTGKFQTKGGEKMFTDINQNMEHIRKLLLWGVCALVWGFLLGLWV